jgi:SulP family sulfate permease
MLRSSPPQDSEAPAIHTDDEEDEMFDSVMVGHAILSQPSERTALLGTQRKAKHYITAQDVEALSLGPMTRVERWRYGLAQVRTKSTQILRVAGNPKLWNKRAIWEQGVKRPVGYIPAIVLGLLLNILDALSYGMILFPLGTPLFAHLGPDGISMFYVSCIISQLTYSLGGSIFKGGIGSEMIEVVPFFHKMAFTILAQVGEENGKSVLATTVLAYSTSSVLTGLVFYLMGQCKLGALIGFFPRHILIGCIGGVGFFLVVTGVEVSARLAGNLEYNLVTLKKLIELDTLPLWTTPLALAITLLVMKKWVKHSLTDAVFFMSIIVVFYVVEAAVPEINLEKLRSSGWVFEAPEAGVPWYHFYSLYDFKAVNWEAYFSTVPAMFALTFFGVLHVPINIPALGLSTGEDNVDVDRELRAHGISNALSGLCGSIQNYLVYTNSVLFMRSGGDSRIAGVLLAAATGGILVVGPVIIGYIPIMVVGALIFFLGFDLLREALWDTIGRVHRSEYLTVSIHKLFRDEC